MAALMERALGIDLIPELAEAVATADERHVPKRSKTYRRAYYRLRELQDEGMDAVGDDTADPRPMDAQGGGAAKRRLPPREPAHAVMAGGGPVATPFTASQGERGGSTPRSA